MTSYTVFTVHCPSCSASYPVDSGKVPEGGIRARCGNCANVFLVELARLRVQGAPESSGRPRKRRQSKPPAPFATIDPGDRAARLARVLVSDMISYHPDRYERALERGTLQEDFADEVRRSWAEYVRQVGREAAVGSRCFQDELNATLARGQKIY